MTSGDKTRMALPMSRSVRDALSGLGIEDVDALRIRGDVDDVTLADRVPGGHADDDRAGHALDIGRPVHERVRAELLHHCDVDGKAPLCRGDHAPGLGADTDGD